MSAVMIGDTTPGEMLSAARRDLWGKCCCGRARRQVVRSLWCLLVWLIVQPTGALCANPQPRSILVLNESAMVGPFYSAAYGAFRSKLYAPSSPPTSIILEQLE